MYYGDERYGRYGRSFSIGQLLGVVGAAFVIASVFMNLVLFRFQGMDTMWEMMDEMLGTESELTVQSSATTDQRELSLSYGLTMLQTKRFCITILRN